MSEAVSSGAWGACGVGAEVWKALNGRRLGGGIAGEAGEDGEKGEAGEGGGPVRAGGALWGGGAAGVVGKGCAVG